MSALKLPSESRGSEQSSINGPDVATQLTHLRFMGHAHKSNEDAITSHCEGLIG